MHLSTRYLPGAVALLGSLALCVFIARVANGRAADTPSDPPAAAAAGAAGTIAVPAGLTLDDVKTAVLEAMAFRELEVRDRSEGSVTAYYTSGNVSLLLRIDYTAAELTLSVNPWESRPKPLKTQQRWMNNIRKDLTDALAKRKALKS